MTGPNLYGPWHKDGGQVVVMNAGDPLPVRFLLRATTAAVKTAIRIAGGCKDLTGEQQDQMLEFFLRGMKGYRGMVSSGATRSIKSDGTLNPMVTEAPPLVAAANPGAVSLGTAPRTWVFRLDGHGLTLSEYGDYVNPGYDMSLIVQEDASRDNEWDGDVDMYIRILAALQADANFNHVGLICFNGGDVTEAEARLVAARGWPVILVRGSGRATDKLIDETAFAVKSNVHVVSFDNPEELNTLLKALGFISID